MSVVVVKKVGSRIQQRHMADSAALPEATESRPFEDSTRSFGVAAGQEAEEDN